MIVTTINTHNMPKVIEAVINYELTDILLEAKIPKLLAVIKNSAEQIQQQTNHKNY